MSLTKWLRLWKKLGRELGIVIPLLRDRRVAFRWKIPVLLAFLYFVFPLDFFPDFAIPVLGYIDDLVLLTWAINYFLAKVPDSIKMEMLGGE